MDAAFRELAPSLGLLVCDVFGNYVAQKFLEKGLPRHRDAVLGVLRGRVLPLSLQTYGCRVVQRALEALPPPAQALLVAELAAGGTHALLALVHDQARARVVCWFGFGFGLGWVGLGCVGWRVGGSSSSTHDTPCAPPSPPSPPLFPPRFPQNGNHVVQKALMHAPGQRALLCARFAGCGLELATHPYGCRVVQRVLEHCSRDEQAAMGVVPDTLAHATALAKDQASKGGGGGGGGGRWGGGRFCGGAERSSRPVFARAALGYCFRKAALR